MTQAAKPTWLYFSVDFRFLFILFYSYFRANDSAFSVDWSRFMGILPPPPPLLSVVSACTTFSYSHMRSYDLSRCI